MTFRIGIISDTHGLLRPEAERRLTGVDQIIHGGDIGHPDIIGALRKIAVVEAEAEQVRMIYRRYLEVGAVNALVRDLRERNIRTKTTLLATGASRGGVAFGRGALFYLLRNRFYIGF